MKRTPDFVLNSLMDCVYRRCADCSYDETGTKTTSTCMKDLIIDAARTVSELMEILTNANIAPTLEEAKEYLRGQGYPDAEFADNFIWGNRPERRTQFWDCVKYNYDLPDFDRWQHFQNAIGGEITYSEFMKIMEILDSHDIEIMEMETGRDSIY